MKILCFFILSTLLVFCFADCDPKCDGEQVCINGQCKSVNDLGHCSVDTDCVVSSSKGFCNTKSSVCVCSKAYEWSYYYNDCLTPNFGQKYDAKNDVTYYATCGSDSDCLDHRSFAGCVDVFLNIITQIDW